MCGTGAFAVVGALVALRKEMDVFVFMWLGARPASAAAPCVTSCSGAMSAGSSTPGRLPCPLVCISSRVWS
ncbi:TRIC cation channel family protein [Nitratireductor mangrovi]